MSDNLPSLPPRQGYADGQVLHAADFQREQAFHIGMRDLQTSLLLAPGVVSGLAVTAQGGSGAFTLTIAAGVAIDAAGRILVLSDRLRVGTQDIVATSGPVAVPFAGTDRATPGTTTPWRVMLTAGSDPAAPDVPRLALVASAATGVDDAADAVSLGTIAVTAAPLPPSAPSTSSTPASTPPDIPPLDITVAVTDGPMMASLRPMLIPPFDATRIAGKLPITAVPPIPADHITGTLAVDQIPAIPAARITDWPAITSDQLPPVPADHITGTLKVDQIPTIPAARITDWPAITSDQLPPVPVAKLAGAVPLAQLPRIPVAQIDGLPGPDTGPVAVARLVGSLGTAQVPALVEILRRLDALESRSIVPTGRNFAGTEQLPTSLSTQQQAGYRDRAGGAAYPNDLADPRGTGFTFQALVRAGAPAADLPLMHYVFDDPAPPAGSVLPGTTATAFALTLRDGGPRFRVAADGGVDTIDPVASAAEGTWVLITCAWQNGLVRMLVDDRPAGSGPARVWAGSDGRFVFAGDGVGGFVGDVAWFALWKGAIPDVRIAQVPRRPFTPDEVAAWAQDGLAGYWPLSSTTAIDVPDLSAAANAAAITRLAPVPVPVPVPAPVPTPTLTEFAGSYTTDTQWWGGYFDPLTIAADGRVTLAGAAIAAQFDPATSQLGWDWTPIRDTKATGRITLSIQDGVGAFHGGVNPRPEDGAVPFISTGFTPLPPPLPPIRLDFAGPAVQCDHAQFAADGGMTYNDQYGGWMLPGPGSRLRATFALTAPPAGDLSLMLYHCTSSLWPNNGFSPVSITLNDTVIAAQYDPATAHLNTGADTTNYLRDRFALPVGALRVGDNILVVTGLDDMRTHYWIRELAVTA